MPKAESDGPMPRTTTFVAPGPPPKMKPPIMTLSLVRTNPRVLMFANLETGSGSKSYPSTKAMPVSFVAPRTTAV